MHSFAKLVSIILLAFLQFHGYAQQIDSDASVVSFRIGNMRINTVSGTFTGMSGSVVFDEQNLGSSSFSTCIDASSVDTGNNRRDAHLRAEDFFHVERFPRICYVSDIISSHDDGFVTRGKLSIKGVTRIVTIPFSRNGNILQGTFTIQRLDYNVGVGTGTFLVSDPVEVTIRAVLLP